MTERSSSNRSGGVCDAVVVQNERAVGPLRLPENRADDFIDQFNRTYNGVGMKLSAVVADPNLNDTNEKIPDSNEAVGDHDSG